MKHSVINQFTRLTEFLGDVLGDDYEIALCEMTGDECKVISASNSPDGLSCNGDVFSIDSEATCCLDEDSEITHSIIQKNGKKLRCSRLNLKVEDNLVGTLCIRFDDSRFRELSRSIMKLCGTNAVIPSSDAQPSDSGQLEPQRDSLAVASEKMIRQVLSETQIPVNRLTMDEKMDIVKRLNDCGVFLFKGAVKQVALRLECSQASIYRYLSKLEQENYAAIE